MTTLQATDPSPVPLRTRILGRPFVRALLAILSVMVPMAATMALSQLLPKPIREPVALLFAAAAMVAGYRLYVRKIEKRDLAELATSFAVAELRVGLGLGTLLVVAVTVVLLACGAYAVTGTVAWTALVKPVPEQVMVAFMEEILFRAISYRLLERSWGTKVALVVSTMVFVLAHLSNEHFSLVAALATAAASLALSGAYLVHRRLWLPIGMHFAWNYLYAGVFAVPVSGHTVSGWIQVAASGPEWLSGGGYGAEGSVIALLAWAIVAAMLLRTTRQRGLWVRKP
jgi:membrane protease YdiL (CAAX protease family)